MKEVFISDKQCQLIDTQIVVQCSCVAHCSYFEITKFNTSDEPKYWFSIISSNIKSRKQYKQLAKFSNNFSLNSSEFKLFAESFDTTMSFNFAHSNDYFILFAKIDKNIWQLLVYKIKKSKKLIFDMTLTDEMIADLSNSLHNIINSEVTRGPLKH